MKKWLLAFAAFSSISIIAQAYEGDSIIMMSTSQMGRIYKTSAASRVSVHDPSIVVDRQTAGENQ